MSAVSELSGPYGTFCSSMTSLCDLPTLTATAAGMSVTGAVGALAADTTLPSANPVTTARRIFPSSLSCGT